MIVQMRINSFQQTHQEYNNILGCTLPNVIHPAADSLKTLDVRDIVN